jgi:choline dehydrogenase-like flavoprotein
MAGDENTGVIELGPGGDAVISKWFSPTERARLDDGRAFAVAALRAAGAREVVWSGLSTSHVQGSAPMGGDPVRSVVNPAGRSHDVAGLYVGDGSLIPASLSVNPSLTIMALAAKVAHHIAEELS